MNPSVLEAKYPISFRKKEAKELGERLKHRQSVNIVGLKRIGISSFLRFFLHHPEIIKTYIGDSRNHLFVPVDLNDLIELEVYPFWTLTLKRIVDEVEMYDLSIAAKKKISSLFLNSIQSQDLFLLIDSVRQAMLIIVSENILPTLFFIRFDRLSSVFTPSFFDNLQGLRDATHDQLSYVFTSFRSLNSIFPEARTSLSVFTQILYMCPALEADMRIICEAYLKKYDLSLSDTIENALFGMVNGSVQYLQLSLIILNEKKSESPQSKQELFDLLVQDERITLQSEELWESLSREEKKALSKVSKKQELTVEEKEKNPYLWDTGLLFQENEQDSVFSPLLEYYLEGHEGERQKGTQIIHLTKKEHLLFKLLESHIGNICEREQIIEAVWPEYQELGISDWAIDRLVARVRVKLRQQESPYEIVTVRTRGYKLSAIKE